MEYAQEECSRRPRSDGQTDQDVEPSLDESEMYLAPHPSAGVTDETFLLTVLLTKCLDDPDCCEHLLYD